MKIRSSSSALPVRRIARHLLSAVLVILLGGLAAATLVKFSPGYGVDERELDSRLSSDSIRAIRDAQLRQPLLKLYAGSLWKAVHGDFGMSANYQQPIALLLRARWKVSARSMVKALLLSFLIVSAVVGASTLTGHVAPDFLSSAVAGALLAVPTGMIALIAGSSSNRAPIALVLAVSPTLFRYTRNVVLQSQNQSFVLFARAQGIGGVRLLTKHIVPHAAAQLAGVAGVSVSLAIGALIPIEYLCDSPGVGQLALQAALARDLPLIVVLTMIVTVITFGANLAADVAGAFLSAPSA